MSKTFEVMKTNVGNMCGPDTSAEFATLIGVWLNDKYLDIARRIMWSALIDNDYTDATEVGVSEYALPTAFEEELFVADITDGFYLKRYTEGLWWQERATAYQGGAIQGGTASRYVILREADKLKLDPTPNVIHTIAMPYKKSITALAADASTVVIKDIEYIMELGAVALGQAYKKQFAKAGAYSQLYEAELAKRIGQEKSPINQSFQFIPGRADSSAIMPMTGWASYDSL
jgi:hypothetical protein